jgi:hypothetical protein
VRSARRSGPRVPRCARAWVRDHRGARA